MIIPVSKSNTWFAAVIQSVFTASTQFLIKLSCFFI